MFPAIAITALVAFAAGVVFHKFVVSEAASVKAHVSTEIEKLRVEVVTEVKSALLKL